MAKTPFTNVMEDGNFPDTASSNGELTIQNQTADSPPSAPWAGDDERTIQDNGTQGKNTYVMGQPSGNSFPSSNILDADNDGDASLADLGLNEGVEVGHDSGIQNYGIVGPAAGGGVERNIKR